MAASLEIAVRIEDIPSVAAVVDAAVDLVNATNAREHACAYGAEIRRLEQALLGLRQALDERTAHAEQGRRMPCGAWGDRPYRGGMGD